jgi:ribosomal-protein-alanine N-acetyltransferase
MAIRTARMLLRPLEEADREPYLAAVRASRSDLDRFMPLHRPGESDEEMFRRQASYNRTDRHSPDTLRCVGLLADGRVAGGFHLNSITRGLEPSADMTWWVASDLTGHGFASEGVLALLSHALADLPEGLGLLRVHSWITRDNKASIRLAERVGLQRDGEDRTLLQTGDRWTLHDRYTRRAWDSAASG